MAKHHRNPKPRPRPARRDEPPATRAGAAPDTDWNTVARWYDTLVGDEGSEYHRHVVLPGTVRLLNPARLERVLDVACGQGVLCRLLAERAAIVTGVDAAPDLIRAARERGSGGDIAYHVGDARDLTFLPANTFAAASCVLAIQNIHPFQPVFAGMARALVPGGRAVIVMMHPAFRGPRFTGWAWEGSETQYRRVDRYLVPRKDPIVTHPGKKTGEYTWSFHRPIGAYVKALRNAGLLVDALEEWPSHKTSEPGPRAAAENRARAEIPMFLAIRAVKVAPPQPADKPRMDEDTKGDS